MNRISYPKHRFGVFWLVAMLSLSCTIREVTTKETAIMARTDEGIDDSIGQRTGWSKSGELRTVDTNKTVSMQAQFPVPGTYTVSFLMSRARVSPSPRALAIIEWAVEGNTVRRVISVSNGASLSGVAEGVHVSVFDDSDTGAPGGNLYEVTINVAKGVRSAPLPATREPSTSSIESTTGTDNAFNSSVILAPAQLVVYAIPQDEGIIGFAAMVGGLNGAPAAGTLRVAQLDASGVQISSVDARDFEWHMIYASAYFIQITNTSAVNVRAQVLYAVDG